MPWLPVVNLMPYRERRYRSGSRPTMGLLNSQPRPVLSVLRVRSLQRPQVLRSDAPLCSCLASLPFGLRDLTHHRSLGMGAAATKRPCATFVPRDPPPRACGIPKRRGRSPVPDRAPVRPVLAGCAPAGPASRPAPAVRPRALERASALSGATEDPRPQHAPHHPMTSAPCS